MKRKALGALGASALIAALIAPSGIAATSTSRFQQIALPSGHTTSFVPASLDQKRSVDVVVKLAGKPVGQQIADAKAAGRTIGAAGRAALVRQLKSAQASTLAAARGLGASVRYTYQTAYNGFSVRIFASRLAALASLKNVIAVSPTWIVQPDNERGIPYIGAPAAWQDLGVTGAGMKIGVIDTGIDYYHANFGGSGNPADFAADDGLTIGTAAFPNAKVAGGTDFVGDAYNADGTGAATVPHPDPDPLDCNGHGSHTSGTAAGYGVLSDGSTFTGPYDATTVSSHTWRIGPGVAPEAQIYAYRVFGCAGSASSDVVIAAIDQAASDGMNVVNMSLGSDFGDADPADPEVEAIENSTAAGTLTVASAGNGGPSAYITGRPASANSAISVAAIDASFAALPAGVIDIGSGLTLANNNGGPLPVGPAQVDVLPDGAGGISLGCDASEYTGTAGKIVVTLRGTCDRVARAKFGQAAGAAAVIMVNNSSGYPPFEGPITGVTIPFLGALSSDAAALLGANGTSHTITPSTITNPGYKKVAGFSSGGPRNGDSAAKPDIAAPGVSLFSTAVGTGTEGVFISGTSMASPHVAGSAILVRQAHPSWTPAQIKAVIENTASADASVLAANQNIRLVGAGVVQPRAAAASAVYATTDTPGGASLSYGYDELNGAYLETHTITFHNTDSVDHSFDIGRSGQASLNASFSLSASSVTVPAGGTASVDLTIQISAANVAALPTADLFGKGGAGPGGLFTVRGVVTATPNPTGSNLAAFRVPYMLVPRGTSGITAGTPSAYSFSNGVATRTATLSNGGIHSGIADVYAWGISDPADNPDTVIDIRNAGVQVLPGEAGGSTASDRLLVFAVNVGGSWSTACTTEFDFAIDTDANGKPDYFVVGVDLGAVLTGTFNGQMASFVFKVNKKGPQTLVDAFYADTGMNGSTLELPALASDLGLKFGAGSFSYSVTGFDIFGALGGVDPTGTAKFDAYLPPISTGDYLGINPGSSATLTMRAQAGLTAKSMPLGWLVVTLDDAGGAGQADTIPLGTVPTH
jgi:minor extracellular serine protease Vpr